jgi:hypothetical protein
MMHHITKGTILAANLKLKAENKIQRGPTKELLSI